MFKYFLTIALLFLPIISNQKANAKDLTGNIGIAIYGGVNVPTNGNVEGGVKSTDFLKVGPQFGFGVSYFFTEGFGLEAMYNYGYNFFQDKYTTGLKDPLLILPSVSLDAVYNFGSLTENSPISTFIRAGVGNYNWSHIEDGNDDKVIKMGDVEHKGSSFGFNVGLGFDVACPCIPNLSVGLIVDYNMYFPKDKAKFGKDFAEQGYLTPQIKVNYYFPTK